MLKNELTTIIYPGQSNNLYKFDESRTNRKNGLVSGRKTFLVCTPFISKNTSSLSLHVNHK